MGRSATFGRAGAATFQRAEACRAAGPSELSSRFVVRLRWVVEYSGRACSRDDWRLAGQAKRLGAGACRRTWDKPKSRYRKCVSTSPPTGCAWWLPARSRATRAPGIAIAALLSHGGHRTNHNGLVKDACQPRSRSQRVAPCARKKKPTPITFVVTHSHLLRSCH
jgi:hypothetical protein